MQEDGPSVSDDEATSPTFGDLIRGSNSAAVINVPATTLTAARHHPRGSTPLSLSTSQQKQQQQPLPASSTIATTTATSTALAPSRPAAPAPALSSLGTVLNQALRTDDAVLLESCLLTSDLPTVRATIQRMDSALAGALLTKLAARMHRRPARAHSLMAWVQWTIVAHGGALAAQPDLVRRLAELSRVLEERARALPSLLVLKGKLDMLDSQMQLRRDNLGAGGRGRAEYDGYDDEEESADEDEEGVVYVEGEEDDDEAAHGRMGMTNGVTRTRMGEDDDLVLANGIGGETDDDDSEDEGSLGGMDVDDDDDAASQGSLDEDEVDFDDVEEESEDETDGDMAGPPTKMQKVGRATRK
jgi:U3 small nucleolar RNA-associated protein 5